MFIDQNDDQNKLIKGSFVRLMNKQMVHWPTWENFVSIWSSEAHRLKNDERINTL